MMSSLIVFLLSAIGATFPPRQEQNPVQTAADDPSLLESRRHTWRNKRNHLINAQQMLDIQCIYMPILQDQRENYMHDTRVLAAKYVSWAEELHRAYEDFSDEQKNEPMDDNPDGPGTIARYHEGEMWIAIHVIFDHRYGKQCSHIYDQELFKNFSTRLHAPVKQDEFNVTFKVGDDWGMELDGKTGQVVEVTPKGFADDHGVRSGDFVWGIDGEEFKYRSYMWLLHIKDECKQFDQFKFKGTITFRRITWDDAADKIGKYAAKELISSERNKEIIWHDPKNNEIRASVS